LTMSESEMSDVSAVNGVSETVVLDPDTKPAKKKRAPKMRDALAFEKPKKKPAAKAAPKAKASAKPGVKKAAAHASKPKPARASSKQASATKKKPGKRGPKAHTRASKVMASQGRYVLVIHMEVGMQKVLDKKIAGTEHSRSSWARQAVAKALGYKETDARQPKKASAKPAKKSAKPAKKKAAKKKLASSV
jgi:hypothetical protein